VFSHKLRINKYTHRSFYILQHFDKCVDSCSNGTFAKVTKGRIIGRKTTIDFRNKQGIGLLGIRGFISIQQGYLYK